MNHSSRIGIAVVGLRFGRIIVEELLDPGVQKLFELKGVCDLDRGWAGEIGRDYGVPVIDTLDDILKRDDIRAVALLTPPFGRAALVRKILEAGRHVMTTKPFEMDPVAAEAVLKEGVRRKRAVHLNSPSVTTAPEMALIREWRKRFDLGGIVGARTELVAKKKRRPEKSWYDDPARCPAAPIFRIGIYVINELVDLFGPAEKVGVLSARFIPTDRETADNAQLSIQFKSGAIANVFVSFCVDDGLDHRHMTTLNFERGTVYRNVGPSPSADPLAVQDLVLVRNSGERWKPVVERTAVPSREKYPWDAFYEAVNGKDPADEAYRNRIVEGVKILAAMARAEKSNRIEIVQ